MGFGTGIASSGYKLVRHAVLPGGTPNPDGTAADELYNLVTDPGEIATHNGPLGATQPGLEHAANAAILTQLRAVIDGP